QPLTPAPSLRDADGYFYPMIFPNENYPGQALAEDEWTLEDVEQEFRAQIELGLKKIPRISHVSGHMGCTWISDEVQALVKELAVEYGLDIMPQELGVTGVSYEGPHETPEEKIESFLRML